MEAWRRLGGGLNFNKGHVPVVEFVSVVNCTRVFTDCGILVSLVNASRVRTRAREGGRTVPWTRHRLRNRRSMPKKSKGSAPAVSQLSLPHSRVHHRLCTINGVSDSLGRPYHCASPPARTET
jgi:hypothetical protein